MIFGRQFTLLTDRKLLRLSTRKFLVHTASRLQQSAEVFLIYDLKTKYQPTTDVGQPDAFSRLIISQMECEEDALVTGVETETEVHPKLKNVVVGLPVTFKAVKETTEDDIKLWVMSTSNQTNFSKENVIIGRI